MKIIALLLFISFWIGFFQSPKLSFSLSQKDNLPKLKSPPIEKKIIIPKIEKKTKIRKKKETAYVLACSQISGKGGFTTCLYFAEELLKKLQENEINCQLAILEWRKQGKSGKHAFVVFQDENGRKFAMDNLQKNPLPVKKYLTLCQN